MARTHAHSTAAQTRPSKHLLGATPKNLTDINLVLARDGVTANLPIRDLLESEQLDQRLDLERVRQIVLVSQHQHRDACQLLLLESATKKEENKAKKNQPFRRQTSPACRQA
jgi:hypothetical protein